MDLKGKLQNLAMAGVAVILSAILVLWLMTRDAVPSRVTKARKSSAPVSKVDERLYETARRLAALADTNAEQEAALEALRLADQELDQDFSTAIREAAAAPPPASGEPHDLAAHIAVLKTRIAAEQQRVAQLTKEAAANSSFNDRLELAKAQLTLDQDELDDTQQELARDGGNEQANLEHALAAHQAALQGPSPLGKLSAARLPGTLREQVQLWLTLGDRRDQIETARVETEKKTPVLAQEHKGLEDKLSAKRGPANDNEEEDPAAVVDRLLHLSNQRKTLASLDKRAQLCQQLAAVYQGWIDLVAERRRGALHVVLGSLALILAIVLAAMMVAGALGHILGRQADRRRVHQSRVIANIAIQLVAVILILLVIFGAPTQMSTMIGLATAGLTVVLKDFIVAFFGWFVLMGRNGIRLGDWVEINGVGGEVVEIGVLRTVLLEMGNWANTGHPTGRRVAFVNNFAIEDHYFNFSTAGQWLWDELEVMLTGVADPYQMAERIRQVVEQETAADAKLAEEDWERVTHQYGTPPFSARPASDLRPGPTGLMATVRYITRAPQRYEVKSRLFHAIVELMHQPAANAAHPA